MPVWRLQTTFQADSTLARDRLVITPHFNDAGALTDPDGLCGDLLTALQTWTTFNGEIAVRAYDAQGTPPVFPQGEAIANVGVAGNTSVPRELAMCLSFYNERNRPRQRGRLYIPAGLFATTGVALRPSSTHRDKVAALVPLFTNLGGSDVDWCVYSRADDTARPVTNFWVDDEWDIMRSRGLRGTTRTMGTTSEA